MMMKDNESNELPTGSMMDRIKKIKEDKIKAGEKPPFFHVLPNKEVQQLMFEAKKMGMVIGMDLEKFGEVDRFMWKVPMMVGKIDDVYIIETVSPSKKEREQSKRYEETVFKVMNILSEDDYSKDTRYSMIKDVIDKCMEDL